MRVVRIYHAGRDSTHRARERALAAAGAEVALVVPRSWPEADDLHAEPFEVVELPVRRAGEVNRHVYASSADLAAVLARQQPDVVDLHEEPYSAVTHQVQRLLPPRTPVVGYAAQNLDKRFPPPYWVWERQALGRWRGAYPCSRQAANVLRGKGFRGPISVLPLGAPAAAPGAARNGFTLGLVGRLVPEKGLLHAVRALAIVRRSRPEARLVVAGSGPDEDAARQLARSLDVPVELRGRLDGAALADFYAALDVLLVPSRATYTWAEQFGRVAVEAAARGAAVAGYASGALPEVLDAIGGVVVPEGDVAALAAAALTVRPGPAPATWADVAQRQLELYERAIRGEQSQPSGRAAARREFGPPAQSARGARPLALPARLAALLDR